MTASLWPAQIVPRGTKVAPGGRDGLEQRLHDGLRARRGQVSSHAHQIGRGSAGSGSGGHQGLHNSTAAGSRYPSSGSAMERAVGLRRMVTRDPSPRWCWVEQWRGLEQSPGNSPVWNGRRPGRTGALARRLRHPSGQPWVRLFARNPPRPERRPPQPPGGDRAVARRPLRVAPVVPIRREAIRPPGLWSLDLAVHARAMCAVLPDGPDSRGHGDRGMFHVERSIGPVVLAHPRPPSVDSATDTPGRGGRQQDSSSRGASRAAHVSRPFRSSP
jgi:hypothetical protein